MAPRVPLLLLLLLLSAPRCARWPAGCVVDLIALPPSSCVITSTGFAIRIRDTVGKIRRKKDKRLLKDTLILLFQLELVLFFISLWSCLCEDGPHLYPVNLALTALHTLPRQGFLFGCSFRLYLFGLILCYILPYPLDFTRANRRMFCHQ